MEIENLTKRTGIAEVAITNRVCKMENRTSGTEDTINEVNTSVKKISI